MNEFQMYRHLLNEKNLIHVVVEQLLHKNFI